MKKILLIMFVLLLFTGCEKSSLSDEKTYVIGLCNYVDDASLDQIVDNIKEELSLLEKEYDVTFEIKEANANGDISIINQIISDFIVDDVDLMIGVATPVALAMQSVNEESDIPVVFAAVSDPVGVGLVKSFDNPGVNMTGTADYLDTETLFNLIFAFEDVDTIGLLYDAGQDSSFASINSAKKILEENGIKYKEYVGTNTSEVKMAVSSIVADGVEVVFTPTDNTIMTAELSIYEDFINNGIRHYAGADSFALNGAFLGFGVDYTILGKETADMVADILVNKKDVSTYPVKNCDSNIVTINSDVCEKLGLDYSKLEELFMPYCSEVKSIKTAESFN